MFCFSKSSVGIPCFLFVVSFILFYFRSSGSTLGYWIDADVSLSTGKGRNPPGDQKEETGHAGYCGHSSRHLIKKENCHAPTVACLRISKTY